MGLIREDPPSLLYLSFLITVERSLKGMYNIPGDPCRGEASDSALSAGPLQRIRG